MGLDITVMIVDWSWLGEFPPGERLPRLRDAWYDDETGFWGEDAPDVDGDWDWPRGPNGSRFAVYEFLNTLGSFKPHFWAGQRWEAVRDHVDPSLRQELDTLLLGLIWMGLDDEGEQVTDAEDFFGDGPGVYGLLLAQPPDGVRELAATWERVRPGLGGMRTAFEHAATPRHWIGNFDEFQYLLEEWGRVLAEAARRGWGVVGLSE